jgi:low temperature requirement protein LtrA
MTLKSIAFIHLLEFLLLKPVLLPASDNNPDVIGYCLAITLLALFGQLYSRDLDPRQRRTALRYGAVAGALGYVWLVCGVGRETRQMHHLLVVKVGILGGVLWGGVRARKGRGGGERRG